MMTQSKFFILTLSFLLGLPTLMWSQMSTNEPPISESYPMTELTKAMVPIEIMPAIDLAKLQQEDAEDELNGIPPRFGNPFDVNYNLGNSGYWETLDNGDRLWRLTIQAPDARSINFLYDDFYLPSGAKLFIYNKDKSHIIGAFTSINNKVDRKMGTGLVYGDEVTLEYYEPENVMGTGALSIARVVHGYRFIHIQDEILKAFGDSGSCNVNTVCPEGDNWRDEIKGVALILVNGNRNCTGSLITNVEKDCTPYFLTANHCLGNFDAGDNASTWTFMWGYESPDCGHNVSDGPTNMVTAGATIISNSGNPGQVFESDFALIELTESPVDAGFDVYFNGFDASTTAAVGATSIHHPSGDVKKITMEANTLISSNYGTGAGVTHWRIDDWESGTTEPGSSGSPLFSDATKRIVGDLSGGSAACSGGSSAGWDAYGQVGYSWDNNATTTRQLKNWLDPNNTGTNFADGHYPSICSFSTMTSPTPQDVCQGTDAVYTIAVSDAFTANVTLTITGQPAGTNIGLSTNPVAPGNSSTLTISNTAAATVGSYTIQIAATDGTNNTTEDIVLNILGTVTVPNLTSPADGATDVSPSPTLTWSMVTSATTYEVQVATDAGFGAIAYTQAGIVGTSATAAGLATNTQYFWRVRAINPCATSAWSAVFDFMTGEIAGCSDFPATGAGPYAVFNPTPSACYNDCTPVTAPFQVYQNESYVFYNMAGGEEYTFSFCDGYDANTWEALVTIAKYDVVAEEVIAGSEFAAEAGCSITFVTPSSDHYIAIITDPANCGGPELETNNGTPTLSCSGLASCCGTTFTDDGGPFANHGNNQDVTYTLCPDAAGQMMEVDFSEFSLEEGGSVDGCYDYLSIYDGNSDQATLIGNYCDEPDGIGSPGTVTSTDASGCLTFVFSSDINTTRAGWVASVACLGALPVELIDFEAQRNEETALLTWETATEYANRGFHIEHSTNGKDFKQIGWVDGVGSTTTLQQYRYTHEQPAQGVNYYRLLQENTDGTSKYSDVETVLFKTKLALSLYPNPNSSGQQTTLELFTKQEQTVQITMYDVTGKQVLNLKTELVEGQNTLNITPEHLDNGVYLIAITHREGTENIKLSIVD